MVESYSNSDLRVKIKIGMPPVLDGGAENFSYAVT